MADTLFRASRSGIINTAHDFSCCLIAHDDELIAAANSLPIHVLSGPELLSRTMKELHPDLRNGDAYLNNSPYHGNTHAADHTLLVPVLDDAGELRFTVMVKAHQADCGNAKPTTFDAEAVDIYDEGALIFPCVKVQATTPTTTTSSACAVPAFGSPTSGTVTTRARGSGSHWRAPHS